MPGPRLLLPLIAVGFAAAGCAETASAQDTAEVRVEVTGADGRAGDAEVILTPEEGDAAPVRCRTREGRCRISGVPRGRYVVTATPSGEGRPPLPRVVWVPPRVPSVDVRVRLR